MTVLHAGGKFGGGGYAVSGGLHGVGVSVVNALSARVETEIHRQGYIWNISFKNGGMLDNALQQGGTTEQTGTIVTFYPDPEIFETTYFDFETLDRKSTRLNSSHVAISYAVFCLKKKIR